MSITFWVLGLILLALLLFFGVFVPWGTRWGSTPEERATPMPGDELSASGPVGRRSLAWTRAISIAAPPETVWPWLAQLGRGAGFYAIELLDNGRKDSARHIVSWIPAPRVGDALAMGYLREVEEGKHLVAWLPRFAEAGVEAHMAFTYLLEPEGQGTRLIFRVSGYFVGWNRFVYANLFTVIDSLMARRQLRSIKARAERYGARASDPDRPETGARDQYQLYEVIYASGERAGVPGKESAAKMREAAIADGCLSAAEDGR